jgi:hypothetical protein
MRKDGSMNEGACNAFSFFAKTALDNFGLEEIDHADLINHYIKADVTHDKVESTTEKGKILTFAHIGNFSVAKEFDITPTAKALTMGTNPAPAPTATPAPQESKGVNLASLLG